jgi:hypothetical protein
MKVADAVDHNFMLSQGYIRMGDYKGSGFETGRKSYYYSTVGGHSVFSQGIMQTVGNTHNGVDLLTGRNLTGMTGGKLSNAETNVIKDKLKNGQGQAVGEPVMPIFDGDGQVMGYERSLSPEMIQKMNKNDNISEMIGAWAGRHVEEATAGVFNEKLIGSLKKIWEKGKTKGLSTGPSW